MSRREREADLGRVLLGGMVGAIAGAAVGLVLFGGIIVVPALVMAVGAWLGVSSVTGRIEPPRRRPARGSRSSSSQRLYSQSAGPAPSRSGGGIVRAPSQPRRDRPAIDVNSATAEELSLLPGVGRLAAERIVAHRESNGRFSSLREIEAVEGFDTGRVLRFSSRATVSAPDAPS
jgi:competence ComEA-like helix-hairpin-helix protein